MLEPQQSLHCDLPIAPVQIRGRKTLARRAVPRRDRDDAGAVDYLRLLCSQTPAPPQSLHVDLPRAPVQIRGRKTLALRARLLTATETTRVAVLLLPPVRAHRRPFLGAKFWIPAKGIRNYKCPRLHLRSSHLRVCTYESLQRVHRHAWDVAERTCTSFGVLMRLEARTAELVSGPHPVDMHSVAHVGVAKGGFALPTVFTARFRSVAVERDEVLCARSRTTTRSARAVRALDTIHGPGSAMWHATAKTAELMPKSSVVRGAASLVAARGHSPEFVGRARRRLHRPRVTSSGLRLALDIFASRATLFVLSIHRP